MEKLMHGIAIALLITGVFTSVWAGILANPVGLVAGVLMVALGQLERHRLQINTLRRRTEALEKGGPRS